MAGAGHRRTGAGVERRRLDGQHGAAEAGKALAAAGHVGTGGVFWTSCGLAASREEGRGAAGSDTATESCITSTARWHIGATGISGTLHCSAAVLVVGALSNGRH